MENALDVFYYDINDDTSCQHQCNTIGACNFFTQLPAVDNSHYKCFLFANCDTKEDCADCLSGPEKPPMGECMATEIKNFGESTKQRSLDASYTCPTTVQNVVDIYYFDADDHDSCQHQCSALTSCGFWTEIRVEDSPHPHNKCFLYNQCDNHEECVNCVNGSS